MFLCEFSLVGEASGVKRRRPAGVTILGILFFIYGIIGLCASLFTYNILATLMAVLGVPYFIIAIIFYSSIVLYIFYFPAAVSLLKLMEWGRKLTLWLVWIALSYSVIFSLYYAFTVMPLQIQQTPIPTSINPQVYSSFITFALTIGFVFIFAIIILITVIITLYLRRNDIKTAFKSK